MVFLNKNDFTSVPKQVDPYTISRVSDGWYNPEDYIRKMYQLVALMRVNNNMPFTCVAKKYRKNDKLKILEEKLVEEELTKYFCNDCRENKLFYSFVRWQNDRDLPRFCLGYTIDEDEDNVLIDFIGLESDVNRLISICDNTLDEKLEKDNSDVVCGYNYICYDNDGDLTKEYYKLYKEEKFAKDHFYPWLKDNGYTIESFIEEYLESDESILLVSGIPGTGKTTFLKTLIKEVYGYYHVHVVADSKLLALNSNYIYRQLSDDEPDVIIIEDADALIFNTRKEGNIELAQLLNVSDGLGYKRRYVPKIIMTTNLTDLEHIDEALLRPGRCFGMVNFRHLTRDETIKVMQEEGITATLDEDKEYFTLAEIMSNKGIITSGPKVKIGF